MDITEIIFKPIGYIETPYKDPKSTPRDPDESDIIAKIIIFPEYRECIFGLFPGDTILVISYLHFARYKGPVVKRRCDGQLRGIFATRSPSRPNPIATSITKIEEIENNIIYVRGIDLIDKTPILDIKIWNDKGGYHAKTHK